MNVKRITAVLLVKEIEPVVPFWVDRLGFAKTIEVPEGNKLGFVAFQKGSAEVNVSNVFQRGKRHPALNVRRGRKRSHLSLYGSRRSRRRARRHKGRENRHASPHRLLRHARIQRSGPGRPLHHLRPTRRSAALTRDFHRTRLHCRAQHRCALLPFTASYRWATAVVGAPFPWEQQSTARHSYPRHERQKSDCRWKRLSRPFRRGQPQIHKPASVDQLSRATGFRILRALDHPRPTRILSRPV